MSQMDAVSVPVCAQPLAYVLENGAEYTREIASGQVNRRALQNQFTVTNAIFWAPTRDAPTNATSARNPKSSIR